MWGQCRWLLFRATLSSSNEDAHRDSAKLQVLMEQWASCEGHWSQSEFYLSIRQKAKHRSYGCRKWLTRAELITKYGSTEIANQIIQAKLDDEEASQTMVVRDHPDLHGRSSEECV